MLDKWIRKPEGTKILLAGGPGSGKTYTAISCLDYVQLSQLRMAPTGRIAQKINGRTIHSALKLEWGPGSLLYDLETELSTNENREECLKISEALIRMMETKNIQKYHIIAIDEIGMIPFWLTECIFKFFLRKNKNCLCVVMGDPHQLRPVTSTHNLFSIGVSNDIICIDLKESKRFERDYEEIIITLREYVNNVDETGLFTYICKNFPAVNAIDDKILLKCTRVMAYTKSTVDNYNDFYLRKLVKGPRIRLWRKSNETNGNTFVDVKKGCLIFLLQNGVSSAMSGSSLIFQQYNAKEDCLECTLKEKKVTINRNLKGDFPIMIGYAGTIHKFQGDTIDDKAIAINFDGIRDLHVAYTALSRVRSKSQIIAIEL